MNEIVGKREQKKAELKRKLINAARARILSHGLSGLRARDITADVGCALGALYTAYEDISELVLHVNATTLVRLGEQLHDAARKQQEPEKVLVALAFAYLDFALQNTALWSAIFEHHMPEGKPVPDWYEAENAVLVSEISHPLASLFPDMSEADLTSLSRIMFSAVHGIVTINLQEKMVSVPREKLELSLSDFVSATVEGLKIRAAREGRSE